MYIDKNRRSVNNALLHTLSSRRCTMKRPCIDVLSLPDITKPELDILESSFFRNAGHERPQLPTPASIISQHGDSERGRVVVIQDRNLAVKIGDPEDVRLEEVQAMCAIRQVFPQGEVPVPEVFGWRRHGTQLFVYMSLVQGKTLRAAWPDMTVDDKETIQASLRKIVAFLREVVQEEPQTIASANQGVVQDRYFRPDYEKGPFPNAKAFHDWMFAAATRQKPGDDEVIEGLDHPDMLRDWLPDDAKIYLTHGDLTLQNIMVSGSPGSFKIEAIIDWEQAGWYPEYWEHGKMHFGAGDDEEWTESDWPGKIIEHDEDVFRAFMEYYIWRNGCTE